MDKIALILCLVAAFAAAENFTTIENSCFNCTTDGQKVFLKVMFAPFAKAKFICRKSALLASQFGAVVDRACREDQCKAIDTRPITRTFVGNELSCIEEEDVGLPSNGQKVVSLIREYLEIVFMLSIMGLLFVKKSMIQGCVNNRLLGWFGFEKTDVNSKPHVVEL